MRCLLYILIGWLGLSVAAADASEVLLGTIIALDRDRGRITLKVINVSGGGQGQAAPESLIIDTAPGKIPGNLSPGDTVRVWGNYTPGGGATFQADSIRTGGLGANGTDPTGVRSRLGLGGQGAGQGAGGRGYGRK